MIICIQIYCDIKLQLCPAGPLECLCGGVLRNTALDLAIGMDTEEMDVVATAAYEEATKDLLN